jgi:hypothetical protein
VAFAALLLLAPTWAVVESHLGPGPDPAQAVLARVSAAVVAAAPAGTVVAGEALEASIDARLPLVVAEAKPIAAWAKLVEQGTDDYYKPDYDAAIAKLSRARAGLLHALGQTRDASKLADALYPADAFLALAYLQRGGRAQAQAAVEELVRLFPRRTPSLKTYGPDLIDLYQAVHRDLEARPHQTLTVHPVQPALPVLLDYVPYGAGNQAFADQVAGEHHVALQGPGARTHAVRLGSAPLTVAIDLAYDGAVTPAARGFVFVDAAARARAEIPYAAQLGGDLDTPNVVVLRSEARASETLVHGALVDATHATVLREATIAVGAGPEAAEALGRYLARGDRSALVTAATGAEPARATASRTPTRVLPWVVTAGAGASLVAALALGLSARSDFDTLNKKYPDGHVTMPADLDTRDGGHAKALASDVFLVVGLGAAATAGYLFYSGRGPASQRALVAPAVGAGEMGAVMRMEF